MTLLDGYTPPARWSQEYPQLAAFAESLARLEASAQTEIEAEEASRPRRQEFIAHLRRQKSIATGTLTDIIRDFGWQPKLPATSPPTPTL